VARRPVIQIENYKLKIENSAHPPSGMIADYGLMITDSHPPEPEPEKAIE
jgi:hypothetical protein